MATEIKLGAPAYVKLGPPPGWRPPAHLTTRRFKYIVLSSEIRPGMEDLVGSKSVGVAMMKHPLELPVPPFIVVSSEAHRYYQEHQCFPDGFYAELEEAVRMIEAEWGKERFGGGLDLAVRGAGPINMPGQLCTKLNVGKGANSFSAIMQRLNEAIDEVLASWQNPAVYYYLAGRGYHDASMSIIIEVMVHGDRDEQSATGIFNTINPITGQNYSGRVLIGEQGPQIMSEARRAMPFEEYAALFPTQAGLIVNRRHMFHRFFGAPQKVEFTQDGGAQYFLQTDAAEMHPRAALEAAQRLQRQGVISKHRAATLFTLWHEAALLAPTLVTTGIERLATGLPVVPGGVSGPIAFEDSNSLINKILVKESIGPEDSMAIYRVGGVVAFADELGAHTAALALGLLKPAVSNVKSMHIDRERRVLVVDTDGGRRDLKEGDIITIDGLNGTIFLGEAERVESKVAILVKKGERAFTDYRSQIIGETGTDAARHALGVLELRDWRKLPRATEDELHLVQWPDVLERSRMIPEIADFPRDVLEAAANLIDSGRMNIETIYEEVAAREQAEHNQWGYRPPRLRDMDGGGIGVSVTLYDKGRQLLYALYYLDQEVVKKVSKALFYVPVGMHDDTYEVISSLPKEWILRFVENKAMGVAGKIKKELNESDYFMVCMLYLLVADARHADIFQCITPEALGAVLYSFWAYKNRPVERGSILSGKIKSQMPQLEDLKRVMAKLEPGRVQQAVEGIRDQFARDFWRKELQPC